LEEGLERELGDSFQVDSDDLYGLPHDTQDAVTAELEERGAGYPVVLVNSAIVCADGIDIDVVIEAAVEARDTQAAREPRLGCNCGRPPGTDC
jgi:hypothetical protein